jgi:hypothetical protein
VPTEISFNNPPTEILFCKKLKKKSFDQTKIERNGKAAATASLQPRGSLQPALPQAGDGRRSGWYSFLFYFLLDLKPTI